MEGTFNTPVVYTGLTLFWISGATCIMLGSQIPILDELLTYGKLATPSLNSLLRSYTLKDSTVWTTLYLFGFLFSMLTSYTVSKYNPTLETPLPLTLFQFQTARRLFDCLAVHRFSTVRQMPVHFLLLGMTYYVAAPLTFSLLPLGSTFFEITPSMRTVIVSYRTSHNGLSNRTDRDGGTVETDAYRQIILFILTSCAQTSAHLSLARAKPVVGKYGVPTSVLFSHIVCPHYTAEVVIYMLLAVCTQTLPAISLLAFVAINLSNTAVRTRKWYADKFPPNLLPNQNRYAIFPFLL